MVFWAGAITGVMQTAAAKRTVEMRWNMLGW
jgi:hypothetical protein